MPLPCPPTPIPQIGEDHLAPHLQPKAAAAAAYFPLSQQPHLSQSQIHQKVETGPANWTHLDLGNWIETAGELQGQPVAAPAAAAAG